MAILCIRVAQDKNEWAATARNTHINQIIDPTKMRHTNSLNPEGFSIKTTAIFSLHKKKEAAMAQLTLIKYQISVLKISKIQFTQ